jgi:periplasmic protein TonB
LSLIFDARKHAEQSKRAREAIAATPQLPNVDPGSSAPKDPAAANQKSGLEPRPAPKFSGVGASPAAPGSSESATNPILGLKVERRATDWRLRWNRAATVNATHGHLMITDGAIQKQLDLDIHELQNGSIVYTPATDDAVLRLEIVTSASTNPITESVRLVAGALPLLPLQTQARHSSPTGGARVARSDGAWAKGADVAEAAVSQQVPIVRSLLRVPRSKPVPTAPPASDAGKQGGTIEPATLISRKEPAYPATANENPGSGTVEVRFRISPEGRVYDVKSASGSPVLAQAAIEAVEAWCYEPARLNGAPVDSEASTNFDFEMK